MLHKIPLFKQCLNSLLFALTKSTLEMCVNLSEDLSIKWFRFYVEYEKKSNKVLVTMNFIIEIITVTKTTANLRL